MLHLNQQDRIRDQLMGLVQKIQEKEEMLKDIREKQEQFVIQLQHRGTLMSNVNYQDSSIPPDPASTERARQELANFEGVLRHLANKLDQYRCQLLSEQKIIFSQLSDIQREILYEHIPRWHLEQQLANDGNHVDSHALDHIQTWVELLTEITWRLRNQLKGMHHLATARPGVPFNHEEELNQFGLRLNKSLEALILNTFVVEKQPPQVMKTNTRFTSTVRFLSGSRLNVHMVTPSVRVSILSEHNARAIMQRHQEILQSTWSYLDHQPVVSKSQISQQEQSQQQHQISSSQIVPMDHHHHHQQQQQPSQQQRSMIYSSLHSIDDHRPITSAHTPQPQPQFLDSMSSQQLFQQQQPPPPPPPSQQPQQQQFHVHQQTVIPSPQYQHQNGTHQITRHSNVININEFDPSGEILNSSNLLEFQESTGQLVCHFRNMQLKKIKRTEKKGTESVMDEKFILVFHSEFRIAEPLMTHSNGQPTSNPSPWFNQGDLSFHIKAFSLPVVVIVHGNQDPHAWATVTWHNAFARPDELLYHVPDKVTWRDLGRVLSNKFRAYAGKGLNDQNLAYLASKISRSKIENEDDIITWNQFAKEPLPDMSFTFWEWFHSILKLTKDHLRELWNADRVYGFVGKKGCVELLLGSTYHEPKPIGTFLLRYSETELGGISIAWVSSSHLTKDNLVQVWQRNSPSNASTNVIMHLQPFLSKDLQTRSLADRIRDLNDLISLHPNIPKDDAFGAYYTPITTADPLSNGYIRPMLIQTLVANYPKGSGTSSINENARTPATPNSYSQSSPDGIYQDNVFMNEMDTSNYALDRVR